MQSLIQGMLAPFQAGTGPHLFTDWRFVRPGQVRWEGPNGQDISLFATEGVPGQVHAKPLDTPLGIRLVAQPATRIGPLLGPNQPWEHTIFWPTLLHDGGKYRLWMRRSARSILAEYKYHQRGNPQPGLGRLVMLCRV